MLQLSVEMVASRSSAGVLGWQLSSIQRSIPAQIVIQVLRGHTVEAAHPDFQAAMVGIHILDMKCTGHALLLADVDLMIRDTCVA